MPDIVVDCGHVVRAEGLRIGYAIQSDGKKICYSCADTIQREDMQKADVFYAYVDSTGNLITWSGGILANAIPTSGGKWRGGFYGSYIYSWRFRDPSGAVWYGRNAGTGMSIKVKRAKA